MAAEGEGDEVEVIVGTYEEFLVGYKLKESKNKYSLEQSFTNHSHSGSVRSITAIGKYLASGSADEAIRLINMGLRVEHGYMQEQSGTITCLTNYGSKYLFSGCQDGTICIWKSGSWICEKTLIAHKGGVFDISVHPTGKLALSVGADKSLKTWNLIKGRSGFITNLHAVGDVVRWSTDGDFYAVGVSNRVDVYNIQTAKVVYSIPFGKRVSSICFIKNDVLAVAGDKDIVEVHSIQESAKLTEFKTHKVRVKDMIYVEQKKYLVTGSNCDELLKFWRFTKDIFSNPPKLLAEVNTTCRITCLTAWSKAISKAHIDLTKPEISTNLDKVKKKKVTKPKEPIKVMEESDDEEIKEGQREDEDSSNGSVNEDEEVDKESDEDDSISEEEVVVKPKVKSPTIVKNIKNKKKLKETTKSKSNNKPHKRISDKNSEPPRKKKRSVN